MIRRRLGCTPARSNTVAVLTNGTAVLGLGNVGPVAALPVMEGKAILFHRFAGIDAYPICLDAPTVDAVVAVAKALAPTFGGINLEDIAAPDCFEIERRLQAELDIPVFHDDQHGTAIVVAAAVTNAARLAERPLSELRVVIVGVGAAGTACGKLLHDLGVGDVTAVDRVGILHRGLGDLPDHHRWFAEHGNREDRRGGLREALRGADVLIGVSGPGVVDPAWLTEMNPGAAVFALANPVPEILPSQVPDNIAIIGTGRSDFPNQINNVLVFPGVFRGLAGCGRHEGDPGDETGGRHRAGRPGDRPDAGAHPAGRVRAGCGRRRGRRHPHRRGRPRRRR